MNSLVDVFDEIYPNITKHEGYLQTYLRVKREGKYYLVLYIFEYKNYRDHKGNIIPDLINIKTMKAFINGLEELKKTWQPGDEGKVDIIDQNQSE